VKKRFSSPTFCNFCKGTVASSRHEESHSLEFIWGLAASGYCCESEQAPIVSAIMVICTLTASVCSYALHRNCHKKHAESLPKSCRITNLPWVFFSETPPADAPAHLLSLPDDVFKAHHWLEGMLPVCHHIDGHLGMTTAGKCHHCRRSFAGLYTSAAAVFRCSRCLLMVCSVFPWVPRHSFQFHPSCVCHAEACRPLLYRLIYQKAAASSESVRFGAVRFLF
jgi:hypothetical protein